MYRRATVRQFRLPGTSFVELQSSPSEIDREPALREQRGLGLAAMGLVRRVGDRYAVSSSIARNAAPQAEVWAEADNRWRCNCREFRARAFAGSKFECEHLIAVKHFKQTHARKTVTPKPELAAAAVRRHESSLPAPQLVRDHSGSRTGDETSTGPVIRFAGDPSARSFAELVSPRQLALIRQLARNRALDVEQECRWTLGCATGDLSKAAAMFFIERLLDVPTPAEAEMRLAS